MKRNMLIAAIVPLCYLMMGGNPVGCRDSETSAKVNVKLDDICNDDYSQCLASAPDDDAVAEGKQISQANWDHCQLKLNHCFQAYSDLSDSDTNFTNCQEEYVLVDGAPVPDGKGGFLQVECEQETPQPLQEFN